jgi:hypothetical protein
MPAGSAALDRSFCCWLLIQNLLLLPGVQFFGGFRLGTPLSYRAVVQGYRTGHSYRSLVQGKFPDVNQNSDSEGSQTGDRLKKTEFRKISEICKTGIRQLLGSPYDSGRNSC